jgi:glutamate--cysteine ligase
MPRKYKEYGINEKPFVVVKADNGTYGMGIMTVRDAKDLKNLNRKTRNKMRCGQGRQAVTEVIIQEGVPTNERVNDAVAEPVVYMIDRYVVGGFYRMHAERGVDENLNAPGLQLRAAGLCRDPPAAPGVKPGASAPNRFYMYGVIGRLAMLAAATSWKPPTPTPRSTSDARRPVAGPTSACTALTGACRLWSPLRGLFVRTQRPWRR